MFKIKTDKIFTGRNLAFLSVLVLFLTLRFFCGNPYFNLHGDQCKYLVLGRNFPWHFLWNDSLYLLHQPFFGFSIGIASYVMPLFQSGLAVTIFWAILAFFTLCRYCQLQGLNISGQILSLSYVSLSLISVMMDTTISRTSVLLFFTVLSLLTFESFLREGGRKKFLLALLSSIICMLISDQALALLPALVIVYVMEPGKAKLRNLVILLSASFLAYITWPLVRLCIYMSYQSYAAGMDGIIENMNGFPVVGIIQPNFLPRVLSHHMGIGTNMDFTMANMNCAVPFLLFVVPPTLSKIIVGSLILLAAATGIIRRDKGVLKLGLLSVLFYLPVLINMPVWYGICYLIPFSAMLGKGIVLLDFRPEWERRLAMMLSIICLLLALLWLHNPPPWKPTDHLSFLFSRQPVTRGQQSLQWLHDIQGDIGIMGPVGSTPEIAYLTGKRVVAIPFNPDELDTLISQYRIQVIVLTDRELIPSKDEPAGWSLSRIVAQHILRNPQKYQLISVCREKYQDFYPEGTFLFFRTTYKPEGQ